MNKISNSHFCDILKYYVVSRYTIMFGYVNEFSSNMNQTKGHVCQGKLSIAMLMAHIKVHIDYNKNGLPGTIKRNILVVVQCI